MTVLIDFKNGWLFGHGWITQYDAALGVGRIGIPNVDETWNFKREHFKGFTDGQEPARQDQVEIRVRIDTGVVGVVKLLERGWVGLQLDFGPNGARSELARKLRLFAAQIERGVEPYVYDCKVRPGGICDGDFIEELSVTLSYPWPG